MCGAFSGLAISNGERWRLLRRFTLSTLRDFGMGRKGMEQWIQEESRHLLESLRENKCKCVCMYVCVCVCKGVFWGQSVYLTVCAFDCLVNVGSLVQS